MSEKFSKFISYFFHPINFPIIGAVLYFLFVPKFIFKQQEYLILTVIFVGTYIFPLVLLILFKKYEMITNYHMVTIEERKYPTLLFTALSFIIGNWLFRSAIVDILSLLFFGYLLAFIASYILLFLTRKISLHMAAIGGLVGFLIFFSYHYQINLIGVITVLFVLSGIIGSSRLKIQAHTLTEVFLGFTIGLLTQFIVYFIYIM